MLLLMWSTRWHNRAHFIIQSFKNCLEIDMIRKWSFLSLFVVVELTRVSIVWTSPRTPRSPCCTRRCWRQWRKPALSVWSECWFSPFELIKYTSFPRPVRKSKGSKHLKQTPEALRRIFCTPYHLKILPRKETHRKNHQWAGLIEAWNVSQTQTSIGSGWIEEELLTDSNEEQNKPKGLWYSHTLFICKKYFST